MENIYGDCYDIRYDDFVNAKYVGGDGPTLDETSNVGDDYLDHCVVEVL